MFYSPPFFKVFKYKFGNGLRRFSEQLRKRSERERERERERAIVLKDLLERVGQFILENFLFNISFTKSRRRVKR